MSLRAMELDRIATILCAIATCHIADLHFLGPILVIIQLRKLNVENWLRIANYITWSGIGCIELARDAARLRHVTQIKNNDKIR